MSEKQLLSNIEIDGIVKAIVRTVPVLEIYLFGSSANGTANEDSDYDFYVVIPDDGIHAREASWKIRKAIPKQTRPVDMLVNTKNRFDKFKDTISFVEGEVVRTGVKLYG